VTHRTAWTLYLAAIIAVGILSRTVHTGLPIFDKYLGDALYAAMIYTILRLLRPSAPVAIPSMLLMSAIELFQRTNIPAQLLTSDHRLIQILARLLGTQFSFLDILAYAVGITFVSLLDSRAPSAT